jgi:mono/diheme cytochrome c family protein
MLVAATTQRAIGWVIFGLSILGFVIYIAVNIRKGKKEVGAEVELAANRKPYLPDDELETKKLERSLLFALGMLGLIAIGLPFYWLREPARQKNADNGFDQRSTSRGAELFEANCAQCHGPDGGGGGRTVTLTDTDGEYYATVNWTAPSLTSVLSRFDEEEVLHVLNYGRNGVMPAFGAPGSGPMTTQQLDDLIHFLRSIQIPEDELRAAVNQGVLDGAKVMVVEQSEALRAEQARIDAMAAGDAKTAAQKDLDDRIQKAAESLIEESSDPSSPRFGTVYGKLLFNNTAANKAYSCARCHTEGWSYDATTSLDVNKQPILDHYDDGNGWFGPSIRGGSEVVKFRTAEEQQEFVTAGSRDGFPYLSDVPSNGTGQMPGFGPRTDEERGVTYPGILTDDQIAAIVAYERSL